MFAKRFLLSFVFLLFVYTPIQSAPARGENKTTPHSPTTAAAASPAKATDHEVIITDTPTETQTKKAAKSDSPASKAKPNSPGPKEVASGQSRDTSIPGQSKLDAMEKKLKGDEAQVQREEATVEALKAQQEKANKNDKEKPVVGHEQKEKPVFNEDDDDEEEEEKPVEEEPVANSDVEEKPVVDDKEKPVHNDDATPEIIRKNDEVQKPVITSGANDAQDGSDTEEQSGSRSTHFLIFFLMLSVVCAGVYIAKQNRKKIGEWLSNGKQRRFKGGRGGAKSNYGF